MLRSTATPVNELRNCSTSQLQELLPNLSRAELLGPRNGCDGSLRIDLRPRRFRGKFKQSKKSNNRKPKHRKVSDSKPEAPEAASGLVGSTLNRRPARRITPDTLDRLCTCQTVPEPATAGPSLGLNVPFARDSRGILLLRVLGQDKIK